MHHLESIHTDGAPAAIGPYSQAVQAGNTLYISGQIPVDPATGKVVEGGIEEQTEQVMKNLGSILREAGMDYEHIVKASVFVNDMHNYGKINGVYARFFNEATAPARELVEVTNLPKFVNVEISVIAVK